MRLKIMLLLIVLSTFSYAQVPQDVDTGTVQKIDQEHKATRKFVSDELTRQRTEFFKQIDERATYYENTVERLLSRTILYLGLLWAGIVILVVGISNYTRLRLERHRFDKMMRAIREQIAVAPTPVADTQRESYADHNVKLTRERLISKQSWAEKYKQKKLEKERQKLMKEKQKILDRESKLGLENKQPVSEDVNKDFSYDFEVDYGR
jgi:hypothetical protein